MIDDYWRQCDCGKSIPKDTGMLSYLCPYCETPHIERRRPEEPNLFFEAVGLVVVAVTFLFLVWVSLSWQI